MILTLIATGPILSCLCVAPISSAPSHFDRTGFTPVQIKIEQIRPISVDGNPTERDLQANVSDSEGSAVDSKPEEGEITIDLAPAEMQGNIPVSNYRGARRMADRLNRVALARLARPVVRDAVRLPEVGPSAGETLPVVTIDDSRSDEMKRIMPDAAPSASGTSPTAPLRSAKPSTGDISGAYVCSYASAEKLSRVLDDKFPTVHAHLGATTGLRSGHRRNQIRAILLHGPPNEVASALEAAQQLDLSSRRIAAN